MLNFIKNNAEYVGALCTVCTLLGGFLFQIGKLIYNKSSKKSNLNKQTIKQLNDKIKVLEIELEKYTKIEKPTDKEYYILSETKTPICPICWEMSKQTIPIYDNGMGYYSCVICGTYGIYSREHINQCLKEENEESEKRSWLII